METTEYARKLKTALRHAFPAVAFKTSGRNGVTVEWADDGNGVTKDQVQQALIAAGFAELDTHTWRMPQLVVAKTFDGAVAGLRIDLWQYNAAERAAEQAKWDRIKQEGEVRRALEQKALSEARHAKHVALRAEIQSLLPVPEPDPEQERALFDAFEQLRQRAEAQVHVEENRQRRPTWAPPLVLGEELAAMCFELGLLTDDDKWIARLWADFASPKGSRRHLRETVSTLPLQGLACRGFRLFAGNERGNTSQILFEAQRRQDGSWRFGPWSGPGHFWSSREREWENLVREHAGDRPEWMRPEDYEARQAERAKRIAEIDEQDLAGGCAYHQRQNTWQRVRHLARARVLDFAGAPDVQMRLAGRLSGHCCICAKALTDPHSLEVGIGPDCHAHRVEQVHVWSAHLRDREQPVTAELIAEHALLPVAFVTEVLGEMKETAA